MDHLYYFCKVAIVLRDESMYVILKLSAISLDKVFEVHSDRLDKTI